jgi:hypothetical protein
MKTEYLDDPLMTYNDAEQWELFTKSVGHDTILE